MWVEAVLVGKEGDKRRKVGWEWEWTGLTATHNYTSSC
jgi:hypothetical protein